MANNQYDTWTYNHIRPRTVIMVPFSTKLRTRVIMNAGDYEWRYARVKRSALKKDKNSFLVKFFKKCFRPCVREPTLSSVGYFELMSLCSLARSYIASVDWS
ncbi:hypothetical protein Zmor_008724 [Zophobas morio]|jgi:hypothetical protein|uniref:Uncharacterized protein n=1 Tax=Zophobas morio TaxID=2755281 RepID=A0AA38HJE9_9CUCU|nr:hypothetical protein Zmor_008724 [Zophobas morio]